MTAVNAHTHLYSGLAPLGMPAPEPPPTCFLEILQRVWWRLDRALDEASLRVSAELYVAEALRSGTAALIDHHESPSFVEGSLDVLAEACERLGMPAILCYGATERNGGQGEGARGLEECRRFIESNRRPRVRGVVGLHAAFTVSDGLIREAAALARETGTVLHLHVAEDQADVDDARARGYDGVVDRLARNDALVPGSIFAHGVHLTRAEVQRLGEAGIWLVQNPRSNHGNGVGYPRSLAASELVALGTDGYPSDLTAEAVALLEQARTHGDDLARVERRPAASTVLFTRLFGGRPAPGPPPDDPTLEAIRARARPQAERLWQRMRAS